MEDSSAVRTGLVPALPLSERSAEKPRPRGAAGESCPQKSKESSIDGRLLCGADGTRTRDP